VRILLYPDLADPGFRW